ncbi:SMP-30/gluconolactonase/LRE family protein [Propionivibrio sp.]|uniref:SMP-30/gluconolactonase/LRE family protein n=1 Tax=Propionivibrio sp. TaxID=2212460 RepID=UPI00272ED5AB|nr:SMP-30/gluconolactonase/LRE family protein [Propionivibrio sp.]
MLTDSFELIDERFSRYAMGNVHLEKLYTGCRWCEGPAYLAAGRYFVWSDIPNNRVMRWDETDGSVSVFQSPSFHANGHTVDREGRLIACEHSGRCVSRFEHDGSRTVLCAGGDGWRFNSPNDVVVKSDGSIWFTDPSYGIDTAYEGHPAPHEVDGCHVWRLDPASGELLAVATDFQMPNGLAFSPDESLLYIADTGYTHSPTGRRHIRRFAVGADGCSLSGGEVFAECSIDLYDGFRIDTEGNLWVGAGDGVHCIAPDGCLIGKIRVPEVVANVCFGGVQRNRLFICGTTSLYSIFVNAAGALRPSAA